MHLKSREVAPLVAGSKHCRTIGTECTGQQVLVVIVVANLTEVRSGAVSSAER